MGQDKAQLEVDGVPMAARVAEALRAAGASEVWAVGGDPTALGRAGVEVVPDDEPGGGPLPATLTALEHADQPMVVVLSCDLVHPSPSAVAAVLEALLRAPGALAAVPVVDGHHQWTHAAWRVGAQEALRAAQTAGATSLRRAAAALQIAVVPGIDPVHVLDADTPEDLIAALRRTPTTGR
jgi:molybdopterin-guanine dinucleotide biosynthesis protein A